jgi:hypothetical protein
MLWVQGSSSGYSQQGLAQLAVPKHNTGHGHAGKPLAKGQRHRTKGNVEETQVDDGYL